MKTGGLTNAVRMEVINEVIAELKSYGHYNAAQHVQGCRSRLQVRMDRVAKWMDKNETQRHTNGKAAHDATGQVEEATGSLKVSGVQG